MGKVLVTTLPKSGTHFLNLLMPQLGFQRHFCDLGELTSGLIDPDSDIVRAHAERLTRVVETMPNGSFIIDHVPYSSLLMHWLQKRRVKVVTLIRNPYDFVVSLSHHLKRHPRENVPADLSLHALQHHITLATETDAEGQILPPLLKRYLRRFEGWVADERAHVLRFEEVIGPRGGGAFSTQLAAGIALCAHLGVHKDAAAIAQAMTLSFNPSVALFRKGQIFSWKAEMMPNTAKAIYASHARVFDTWGYDDSGAVVRHINQRADMPTDVDAGAEGLVKTIAELRAEVTHLRTTKVSALSGKPAKRTSTRKKAMFKVPRPLKRIGAAMPAPPAEGRKPKPRQVPSNSTR